MSATVTRQPTRLDLYRQQLFSPGNLNDLKSSLPKHIPVERFERNLLNVLMTKPKMMEHDPRLLWREVAKAAALGLLLDPQMGEAYLVDVWDGKAKKNVPQLRVGYRGLIKLARQSGEIAKVYARAVYANDQIECVLGLEETLVHRPVMFGDRGECIGYYAVAAYADGTIDFEPMSLGEVDAIRDRSDAYKAFKKGLIKSTPWDSDPEEMGKKTAIRRLMKRLPQSPDLARALAFDDREEAQFREAQEVPAEPARVSRLDVVRAAAGVEPEPLPEPEPEPELSGDEGADTVDQETGEVLAAEAEPVPEAEKVAAPAPAKPPRMPAARRAAEPPAEVENAPADDLADWARANDVRGQG